MDHSQKLGEGFNQNLPSAVNHPNNEHRTEEPMGVRPPSAGTESGSNAQSSGGGAHDPGAEKPSAVGCSENVQKSVTMTTEGKPEPQGTESGKSVPDSGDTASKSLEMGMAKREKEEGGNLISKEDAADVMEEGGGIHVGAVLQKDSKSGGLGSDEQDEFEFKSLAHRVRKLEQQTHAPGDTMDFRVEYDAMKCSKVGSNIMAHDAFKVVAKPKGGEEVVLDLTNLEENPPSYAQYHKLFKALAQTSNPAKNKRKLNALVTPYLEFFGKEAQNGADDEVEETNTALSRYQTVYPSNRAADPDSALLRGNHVLDVVDARQNLAVSALPLPNHVQSTVNNPPVLEGSAKGVWGPIPSQSAGPIRGGPGYTALAAQLESVAASLNQLESRDLPGRAGGAVRTYGMGQNAPFRAFTDAAAAQLFDNERMAPSQRKVSFADAQRNPRGKLTEDVGPTMPATVKTGKSDIHDGGTGGDPGIAGTGAAVDKEGEATLPAGTGDRALASGSVAGVKPQDDPKAQDAPDKGDPATRHMGVATGAGANQIQTKDEQDELNRQAWLTPYAKKQVMHWGKEVAKVVSLKAMTEGLRFIGNRVIGIGGDSEPTAKGASSAGAKRKGRAPQANPKRQKTVMGQVQSVQQQANENEEVGMRANEENVEGMTHFEKSLPYVR